MKRILITGSRDWWDVEVVRAALLEHAPTEGEVVVVHGDARGADRIAATLAEEFGWATEPHPADWNLGKHAGPRRNARMVARGAAVCLAFPLPNRDDPSRRTGTEDCIAAAQRARIPVRIYRPTTPDPNTVIRRPGTGSESPPGDSGDTQGYNGNHWRQG